MPKLISLGFSQWEQEVTPMLLGIFGLHYEISVLRSNLQVNIGTETVRIEFCGLGKEGFQCEKTCEWWGREVYENGMCLLRGLWYMLMIWNWHFLGRLVHRTSHMGLVEMWGQVEREQLSVVMKRAGDLEMLLGSTFGYNQVLPVWCLENN